jgi:hypothetical protein
MKEVLAGLRLAITVPPRHFFGGVDRFRAIDTAEALRRLGATVFEFETDVAYGDDQEVLGRQIDSLKGFQADALVSASQAGYILQAGMYDRGSDQLFHSHNLFFDVPGLRMIMYWDHIIPQMTRFIINRWPSQPSNSGEGVLSRMRDVMRHPRMVHFIPDSGHVMQLQKMQVLSASTDYSMVTNIPRVFIESGEHNVGRAPEHQIAFFGNLYLAAARKINYGEHAALREIRETALDALQTDWSLAPFHAYTNAIGAIDPEARAQLHLGEDESFYWRFLFDELSVVANGEPRFRKINSLGRPICYFGGFADMESRAAAAAAGWTVRETAPYGAALADLYTRACVSIDVVNAPFIAGFSPKLFECYAAGGFMLTSRCGDLAKAIGGLADSITFSSAEELRAKVDWYLSRPHERQQIAHEIREIVRREHLAESLLRRTIPMALDASNR